MIFLNFSSAYLFFNANSCIILFSKNSRNTENTQKTGLSMHQDKENRNKPCNFKDNVIIRKSKQVARYIPNYLSQFSNVRKLRKKYLTKRKRKNKPRTKFIEVPKSVPQPGPDLDQSVPQPGPDLDQNVQSVPQPGPDLDQNIQSVPQPGPDLDQNVQSVPQPGSDLDQNVQMTKVALEPKPTLRTIPQPQKLCFNSCLLGLDHYLDYGMQSIKNVVEYELLHPYSTEWRDILMLFPPSMYVKRIDKIINPFLEQSFQLTREFHYNKIEPVVLFHGTKYKHLADICTYNFNWRLNGLERGHRCGKGVNFTLDPEFAGHFCDQYSTRKVVIIAEVLIIKDSIGHQNMEVPPDGYDTATRKDKRTFVKFGDSEFLPKYVVTFEWNCIYNYYYPSYYPYYF